MLTIPQAFDRFRRSLELTDKQSRDASDQQSRVRETLRVLEGYQRHFLTGSYRRHTCVRPLKDIDFFVVVEGARQWWNDQPVETPRALLRRVKRALDTAWPNKEKPKQQMRSINIEFAGTDIGYDAVPAYEASGQGYWIPDLREGWIRSDPSVHEAKLTAANRHTSGRLVPLIKLIKQWRKELKRTTGQVPFSGFHLETLAVRQYRPRLIREFFGAQARLSGDLASDLVELFDHVAQVIDRACPEPAELGPNLDQGMNRVAARRICEEAASAAKRARHAEQLGDVEGAHRIWSGLLGGGYAFR